MGKSNIWIIAYFLLACYLFLGFYGDACTGTLSPSPGRGMIPLHPAVGGCIVFFGQSFFLMLL